MVGQATLDRLVGVRIPVPQLSANGSHSLGWEPFALGSPKNAGPWNAHQGLERCLWGTFPISRQQNWPRSGSEEATYERQALVPSFASLEAPLAIAAVVILIIVVVASRAAWG